MGVYTDAILKQGEAHAFTRDRAFEHLEALRSIRQEDAALRQQIKEEATGVKLVGPDGRPIGGGVGTPLPKPPYPQTQPQPGPPPPPPVQYRPITTTGGAGAGESAPAPAANGGGSSFGSRSLLQSREGNFATLDWIKKNGRKIKIKIFNPANPTAMFANPPDLVDVDAWATSLGTFIDPDSLAALGSAFKKVSSSSAASSGSGGGYIPPTFHYGRQSGDDTIGQAPVIVTGGKSLAGGSSGGPAARGNAEAPSGPGVKVTVQVPGQTPARPAGPTPGENMIHHTLSQIEGVLREIKNAPARAGGIGLNREKL